MCLAAPVLAADRDQAAARELTTGEAIYRAGCAGCHGTNGEGAPQSTVGFDPPATFPDFTDCQATARELDVDWKAIVHDGGRRRGFSPIMPSFAEALSRAQINAVVEYLRGFCRDRSWPRGELNLPRAFVTEKAFPEDEAVIATAIGARHAPDVTTELVYERRFGARNQLEVSVPFAVLHDTTGRIARGIGDLGLGMKRALWASDTAIFSAQAEVVLPTGDKTRGLGAGTTVIEAFASHGQILPAGMFVQLQAGVEQPVSAEEASRAVFGRAVVGHSLRDSGGLGRLWAPMLEVLADRDLADGAATTVDLVPQIQVALNRRQHIRANVGLQVPVRRTEGRSKQIVFYVLWDWFDGGIADGWR